MLGYFEIDTYIHVILASNIPLYTNYVHPLNENKSRFSILKRPLNRLRFLRKPFELIFVGKRILRKNAKFLLINKLLSQINTQIPPPPKKTPKKTKKPKPRNFCYITRNFCYIMHIFKINIVILYKNPYEKQ